MRILYSDNGTLTEVTKTLGDYKSGDLTFSYVAGQDYIYIGSDVPLNHFYIKMGATVNAVSASMIIEIWNGKEWIDVVHTLDESNALFLSGFVEFVPDRDDLWQMESTNYKGEQVTGLSGVVIYDQYWFRISFDATLTPSTVISWIGNLFSVDNDLFSEFPVFNSSTLKTAFESSKTTWEEQHVRAAEMIIKDLKKKQIISAAGQILERDDYRLASVSKTAQIIFTAMGDDYLDDLVEARKEYDSRLDSSIHKIDRNADGILDEKEKFVRSGFMTR